jgi:hypothetical protein
MAIIYMHRNAPTPNLPEALSDLQPLLDRLLGKEARERFKNAAECMRAIDAARAAWLTKGAMA